jgi:hypothetical protein
VIRRNKVSLRRLFVAKRRRWGVFLLRWMIVGLLTGLMFAVVFAIAETLFPILTWLGAKLSFSGSQDLINAIQSVGPPGLAGAVSIAVIRLSSSWANSPIRKLPAEVQQLQGEAVVPSAASTRTDGGSRSPLIAAIVGWAVLILGYAGAPLAASAELRRNHTPGTLLIAASCFVAGGIVVATAVIKLVDPVERWLAGTVGRMWRGGVADLRGTWRSTYRYRSKGADTEAIQVMRLTQVGRVVVGTNIGGPSPHRHAISMHVRGDFVTGEWRNTMPNARHRGVLQLRIKANGAEMVGRWIGFDSDTRIQEGPWRWERM